MGLERRIALKGAGGHDHQLGVFGQLVGNSYPRKMRSARAAQAQAIVLDYCGAGAIGSNNGGDFMPGTIE